MPCLEKALARFGPDEVAQVAVIGQRALAWEAGVETCWGSRRRCLLHRDLLTAMQRGYAGTAMSRLPLISP
jgi:hypothetical protein